MLDDFSLKKIMVCNFTCQVVARNHDLKVISFNKQFLILMRAIIQNSKKLDKRHLTEKLFNSAS